jgi:hypothetical protein
MFLKSTLSVTSQVVGSTFSLQIDSQRVNQKNTEANFRITIPSNAYNLASATYSGSKISTTQYTITVPISTTSILVQSMAHLQYIPPVSQVGSISVETIDSQGNTISESTVDMSSLIASVAAQSQVQVSRNNDKSNTVANLTVSYTPKYAYNGCLMSIELPLKQAATTQNTLCKQGTASCQSLLLGSDQRTLTLTYQAGSDIILLEAMNLYPNSNKFKATLSTPEGYPIEIAEYLILPEIVLEPLSVSATLDKSEVSTNSVLSLEVTTFIEIGQGSSLEI